MNLNELSKEELDAIKAKVDGRVSEFEQRNNDPRYGFEKTIGSVKDTIRSKIERDRLSITLRSNSFVTGDDFSRREFERFENNCKETYLPALDFLESLISLVHEDYRSNFLVFSDIISKILRNNQNVREPLFECFIKMRDENIHIREERKKYALADKPLFSNEQVNQIGNFIDRFSNTHELVRGRD